MATPQFAAVAFGLWLAFAAGAARAQKVPMLLLFGGSSHATFLGCVNCSNQDEASICNKYGKFGSEYQMDSIWNAYGTYGSPYQAESPWNKYASPTTVIVDKEGNFYGYLTANEYAPKRTTIAPLNQLAELAAASNDLAAVRDAFCGE